MQTLLTPNSLLRSPVTSTSLFQVPGPTPTSGVPGQAQEEEPSQQQAPTTQDEPLKTSEHVGTFYCLGNLILRMYPQYSAVRFLGRGQGYHCVFLRSQTLPFTLFTDCGNDLPSRGGAGWW